MLFSLSQLHLLLDWKSQYRAWVMTAVPPWRACIPQSCCWLYLPFCALYGSLMVKVFSPHLNVLHLLLVFLHSRPVLGHLETVWHRVVSPSQTLRLTWSFFGISPNTSGMIVNWVPQPHGKAQVRQAGTHWLGWWWWLWPNLQHTYSKHMFLWMTSMDPADTATCCHAQWP
jgi:hypothetical protein